MFLCVCVCVFFSHWLALCHSQSFCAKLSDFGVADFCLARADAAHVSTRVNGTHDYFAPEYIATGKHGMAMTSLCRLAFEF